MGSNVPIGGLQLNGCGLKECANNLVVSGCDTYIGCRYALEGHGSAIGTKLKKNKHTETLTGLF